MSPSGVFFLLILVSMVDIKTSPEKGCLLYSYGTHQEDESNPKHDDGTSEITPSVPFTFYGKTYQTVFVNNNGVISFDEPIKQYTPDPFPLVDGHPFMAPYWADVENVWTRGDIFYHQTTDAVLLEDISQDISQYFPKSPFTTTWALVATWDPMAYYGSTSEKGNTFQAVLTTDSKMFYTTLNYWDIQWTTWAASNGDAETGLGGTPAHVGGEGEGGGGGCPTPCSEDDGDEGQGLAHPFPGDDNDHGHDEGPGLAHNIFGEVKFSSPIFWR
ncbi:LOW QUALITY PROTEIN: alpha-tectorin-like [Parus major]|uniref:LOW QUALITY PROTEIN: alpha-tectorin-like n=1 Tax=Parus major TaxID=9157 RepID=UPI0014448923|nr:LOW QUALITY PROTEIN: alpha-tectorin-like [Parus major]